MRADAGRRIVILLGVVTALTAALYLPGLGGGYYGDDYLFLRAHPVTDPVAHFLDSRALSGWYRPLEATFLSNVQARVGRDPRPVHATVLGFHILLLWLVTWVAWRETRSAVAVTLAAAAMAFTQANAMAVLGTDTLSQVMSATFGFAAVALLDVARERHTVRTAALVSATVLYALTLFSKESGIAFLAIGLLVLGLAARPTRAGEPDTRPRLAPTTALAVALLWLAVTAAFLALRTHAGAPSLSFGERRYQLHLGANLVVNAALLLLAPLLAGSSLWLVDAWRNGNGIAIAAQLLATLVVATAVVTGLARSSRRGTALKYVAGAALAVAPVLPLNRVSELYAYAAMPFACVVVGIAGSSLWQRWRRTGRIVMLIGVAALALPHAIAVIQKRDLAVANGERATRLVATVESWVHQVPIGGTLLLVDTDPPADDYSVYRMRAAGLLEYTERWLRDVLGRPDLHVRTVTVAELASHPELGRGALLLECHQDRVRPLGPWPVEQSTEAR